MVQFELPEKKLSHLVNRYYDVRLDHSSSFAQNRMISLSLGNIYFTLKGSGYNESVEGTYPAFKYALNGQHYPLFSFEHEGPLYFCGVGLRATAAFKLFNIHIGELKNSSVDLTDIIGKEATDTGAKLQQAGSWPQRVDVLRQFMKKRSLNIPFRNDHLDLLIDRIYEKEGKITVKELCRSPKVSRSYLEKRFRLMLNLTPGQFIRHVRLHFVCSNIARGKTPVNDVLENYGYYDRSHFMKQFKKHMNTDLTVLSNGQQNLFKEVYKQIHQTD